ncbi:MAG: hypothetical protein KH268_07860 [Clostridiales bacterium]|nr:hypothetical protein [Clostridiales bacterium]
MEAIISSISISATSSTVFSVYGQGAACGTVQSCTVRPVVVFVDHPQYYEQMMSAFIIPFFEFLQKQYERNNIKSFKNEIFYCYYVLYHIYEKKEGMFCFALSLNLKTKGDPCRVFPLPTRWPENTFYFYLFYCFYIFTIMQ